MRWSFVFSHKMLGSLFKRHPPETLTDCQIVDFVFLIFIFVFKDLAIISPAKGFT